MITFIDIVRPLLSTAVHRLGSTKPNRFNPSIHAFQHPTRAMTNLSVDFSDLPSMLHWMCIRDLQDHRSFATKTSTLRSGGVLRLLGSKCTIQMKKEGNENGGVDVDCVMPFVTCTASLFSQLQSLLSEEYSEGDAANPPSIQHGLQTNVVFYRRRENYDACQGRFLSPWRARRITLSPFINEAEHDPPSKSSSSNSTSTMGIYSDTSFGVQWSRCAALPSSSWTDDATFTGSLVMGTINLFFPSVTFFGPSTIAEIQALLAKHFP